MCVRCLLVCVCVFVMCVCVCLLVAVSFCDSLCVWDLVIPIVITGRLGENQKPDLASEVPGLSSFSPSALR